MASPRYNCSKCPGYCCSYPIIPLTKRDLQRLAGHFGLSFTKAKKKFTVKGEEDDYLMRRKADEHFGRICQFFDTDKRRCTVYEARPSTCRQFPGTQRCGYYDFLTFERALQEDKDTVATTDNR
jgi:Fe-S-cluster containining protein